MADEAKREIPFKILVETLAAEKSVGELRQEFKDLNVVIEQTKVGTDEYKQATTRLAAVKEVLGGIEQDINEVAGANKNLAASVSPLAKEYRELRNAIEGGKLSADEMKDALVRASQVKSQIRELREQIVGLDPEKRFQAIARFGSVIASGFAAAQSAAALFGKESEDLVKVLVKVQAATALAQGLQGLSQLRQEFRILKIVAVDALNGIKAAITSTGIGAIVVLLGTIVAYWDKIKAAVSGVSIEQKKLLETELKSVKAQQDKLDAISKQENILRLMGKTEEEILDMKIKESENTKQALIGQLKAQEAILVSQIEAERRNKEILSGILKFITAPITFLLFNVDLVGKALGKNFGLVEKFTGGLAKFGFDPEETRKEGDESLKAIRETIEKVSNDEAGFLLKKKDIRKKDADEQKKDAIKAASDLEELRKRSFEDEIAILEARKLLLELEHKNTAAIEIEIADKKYEYIKNKTGVTNRELERAELEHTAALETIFQKQVDDAIKAAEEIVNAEQKKWEDLKKFHEINQQVTIQTVIQDAEQTNDPVAIENAQFQERLLNFQSFQDQVNALDVDANDKKDLIQKEAERLEKEHQNNLNKITKSGAEQRRDLNVFIVKGGIDGVNQLVTAFSGKSEAAQRRAFNINKFAGIAQATVDTYVAAQGLFKSQTVVPTPDAPIRAQAAAVFGIISGLARVAAISKTEFNSSGAGGGASGGGGGSFGGADFNPPQIAPPQLSQTNLNTDANGNFINFGNQPQLPQSPLRAYIVETDVSSIQKRVRGIEQRAEF